MSKGTIVLRVKNVDIYDTLNGVDKDDYVTMDSDMWDSVKALEDYLVEVKLCTGRLYTIYNTQLEAITEH